MNQPEKLRLSANVQAIFGGTTGTITFGEFLERVSHHSFGVLLAILALPSALPVPAPGYSVPFGIALFFLGFQMILGRDYPWFPEKTLRRKIKTKENGRMVGFMVKFLSIFETFIRPRFSFVYTNKAMYRFLGCIVIACGVSMCIPIPLTNTAPALGIFLIGIGTLEDDGLVGLAGIAASIAGLMLAAVVISLVAYMGMEAVDLVKEYIKSFI
jgi:hypothetical protein